LHVESGADAPDEFRFAAYSGKHSGEKNEAARLHRFRVDAERLRRCRKLDAKLSLLLRNSDLSCLLSPCHLVSCLILHCGRPMGRFRHAVLGAQTLLIFQGTNPAS
jgi:hypothetical protein